MTPGIHPQSHRIKVIKIEPQPLSSTASGGHIIESKTLQKLIIDFLIDDVTIGRKIITFVTTLLN